MGNVGKRKSSIEEVDAGSLKNGENARLTIPCNVVTSSRGELRIKCTIEKGACTKTLVHYKTRTTKED